MKKSEKKKLISLFIALIILFGYYIVNNYNNSSYSKDNNYNEVTTDLKVYFFDVGQADSILISNNNHHMLIDAGNNADGPLLVKYIKEELKITKFDYVIGTHPHEDHIGGLDNIIDNFEVEKIYLPNAQTTTKTFEDVLDSISAKNLKISIPKIGETFSLGEALFTCLYTGNDNKDLNNSSIVLKMIFGNYSYLFTGDATESIENEIIKSNIDIDVLKVAHHGSLYSTTEKFLLSTTPKYAIISVGKENTYNHPSQETLSRLRKYTDKIYLTSDIGTILLTSDGQSLNINSFSTNTNG